MEEKKDSNQPNITEPVSGVMVDGQKWTFVGIPTEAFYQPPSPFGDQTNVPLYFVEKTELHPEWGFVSYRRNHKYPFKGIVTPELLGQVNIAKRLLRNGARFLVKGWVYWLWNLAIPFWRKKFLWDLADFYSEFSFLFLRKFYIKTEWCAPCVKEYYRVAQRLFWNSRFTEKERWIVDKLVLAGGMFLECDDSYRYRAQDLFGELNKEQFMKSPSRELGRLFRVLKDRGTIKKDGQVVTSDGMGERFTELVLALQVLFFLFPSWRRKAKEFVREINLDKMKLDEGDWYYCLIRPDYRYGGVSFEERIAERKKVDGELFDKIPKQYDIEPSTSTLGLQNEQRQ